MRSIPRSQPSMYLGIAGDQLARFGSGTTGGKRYREESEQAVAVPTTERKNASLRREVELLGRKLIYAGVSAKMMIAMKKGGEDVGRRSQHQRSKNVRITPRDNRRYSDPQGRHASQGFRFFLVIGSSTSMASSSTPYTPALSALLLVVPADSTPIFCLSAISCIKQMSAPPPRNNGPSRACVARELFVDLGVCLHLQNGLWMF